MGALAWFRRHWKAILGGIFLIPPILRGLRFVLDFGGYIDFVVAHMTEPGWLGVVIANLVDPPSGIILPLILLGLGLIYWDAHRFAVSAPAPHRRSDANLVFECHLADLPTKVSADGEIATLPLFYSPGSGGEPIGLAIRHGQPGSDWDWFRDLKFPQVYRCEITNYGTVPLLQVTVKFKIEYRKTLATDTGRSAGNVVHTYDWPVLLSKIDPGSSNAATFYVYNQSRYHARVSPPDTAVYIVLGQNTPRESKLVPIGMVAGMSLWPVGRIK